MNFTINEILGLLEQSTFNYEILTNLDILSEPTEDCLYRHVFKNFPGYKASSITIYHKDNEQYLNLKLKIRDDITLDKEDLNKVATIDNMKLCFINHKDMISSDGKFIIPYNFEGSVHIEDDRVDVEFVFSHVDNEFMKKYIALI